MRYVPSTRAGSLLMGAMRQAASAPDVTPEVAEQTIAETLTCVEIHENGGLREGEFATVNCQMSDAFLDWAHALDADDPQEAQAARAKLDTLADAHPFNYHETRAIYEQHHKHITYAAAKQNYRAWDGQDPTYAVIGAQLADDAKVAIIGDWGTGEPDANALIASVLQHRPDVILHLGDVYDAGMPLENEEHFLKPIDDACATLGMARPPILSIPGNHEYYSGAVGFFQLIDVLNQSIGQGGEWIQEASFFCLRSANGKYQFLGADSGLGCIDHPSCPNLEDSEIAWHRARIAEFDGTTIFMTHHQFIAVDHHINHGVYNQPDDYGYFNRHFVEAFKAPIPNGKKPNEQYLDRIALWLWGHAHWFVPFRPNLKIPDSFGSDLPILRRGQLLGGSAREKSTNSSGVDASVKPWVLHQSDLDPKTPPSADHMILPGAINSDGGYGKLYNHTWALLDLGAGKVDYFQFPAWSSNTTSPDTAAIKTPLLPLDL